MFQDYVALWDNESDPLLLKIRHQADQELEVTITWGDSEIPDTPPYRWETTRIRRWGPMEMTPIISNPIRRKRCAR